VPVEEDVRVVEVVVVVLVEEVEWIFKGVLGESSGGALLFPPRLDEEGRSLEAALLNTLLICPDFIPILESESASIEARSLKSSTPMSCNLPAYWIAWSSDILKSFSWLTIGSFGSS